MKKTPAFTLVEFLITITVVALLTTAMRISFGASRVSAEFKQVQTEIVSLLQEARNLGFSNLYTDGISIDYYEVGVQPDVITLRGYEDGTSTVIREIVLPDNYSIDSSFDITYTPPDGEISFGDGSTSQTFELLNNEAGLSATFVISIFGGGYPEVL